MIAILALLAAFTPPAYAVDTSGCSQTIETTARAATAAGNALTATYVKAPRENCWNANQARLTIGYRFTSAEANPGVSIWVKLNGRDQTVAAQVTCSSAEGGINKDTSNARRFACSATASIPAGGGAQNIEIAPAINGAFDTSGYGQNIRFTL